MLIEVKVPQLSESVAEATLISWHKQQGEMVNRGENLIDVETDKVVLELPAPQQGILAEIIKGDGTTVKSGEVIAKIETEIREAKEQPKVEAMTEKKTTSSEASGSEETPSVEETEPVTPKLMPAAKKVAEENNLSLDDLNVIKGTGRDSRITKEDILAYVKNKTLTSQAKTKMPETVVMPATGNRPEQRVPMTRLRMRIAERLVQSQATTATLTTFNEVNMQAIIDLRTRYKDTFEKEHGVKLGITSFFVKAAVAALKKFPIINASVDGNDIVYHGYYDIGIAVASPRGLVVPIIRNADQLSLAEIEKQIADFSKRAHEGKLTIEELMGGTFSITNGGVFGSMLSTPIINPPQSAILGIHATKQRPVVENGQIVIRPINYLALSYDHRIIDGREAVLSLVAIKEALEYPVSPLFEQ
ncbi:MULTISPECIES: 2-oxoglutarate dehydrogenase complex dihydrolipoyllysine-residue succinyltransferase [Nitrosomonas]|uniref:Dihydrolipoyllysine-residue succinyltransferase component of 2-oxoglutarate dehydrogenase complex n=1 Tax=Nitrosomonas communis TaxID=44574 RepID=A0A0F7KIV1_9PROT|nr:MULTISPECIES: 2-oxoglutarate dehydrogenase complex dihydrolipoyllysine-residue succinyltransferase [Nitrosomonas]AKH39038.1 dihydrolipoamide succinyltransferase [Nitrosomonas communis]TYP80416.1 2-oxoglutarate dehydrogenase E2 component (dihydrolipoamide succinyltransferase) [Nitrosomonas communis]UVS61201.1 2-oxoglutarate dehydrogenase complex dihydrolipoyllysine-residue succinyltransferase [Nitrosomonas sp. PLL12]